MKNQKEKQKTKETCDLKNVQMQIYYFDSHGLIIFLKPVLKFFRPAKMNG